MKFPRVLGLRGHHSQPSLLFGRLNRSFFYTCQALRTQLYVHYVRIALMTASLGEDDLSPASHVVELTDGDDVINLIDELVTLDTEQVDRSQTCIQPSAGV